MDTAASLSEPRFLFHHYHNSQLHRKSQIFLMLYMSSIFKVALSAQGCCHFISGPHFKVHQDQRPQQKICVYDNYRYFHLFRIESLCSLGKFGAVQLNATRNMRKIALDNLQAYSYMHCRELLKMHGDCSNRGADSSQSAFIPLFKL